jgi:hypothetical protein
LGDGISGFDFPDAPQSCAGACVRSADSVAIPGGAVKRGIVTVGANLLRESVTKSINKIPF